MKTSHLFGLALVILVCCCRAEELKQESTNNPRKFSPDPQFVSHVDALPLVHRDAFLVAEAEKNINTSDEEASWRKASAIRMLAQTDISNKVQVILGNLSFQEEKFHTFPAYYALIEIGSPVASNVFEFALSSTDPRAIDAAGAVLYKMWGRGRYFEIMSQNKERIPESTYQILCARDINGE